MLNKPLEKFYCYSYHSPNSLSLSNMDFQDVSLVNSQEKPRGYVPITVRCSGITKRKRSCKRKTRRVTKCCHLHERGYAHLVPCSTPIEPIVAQKEEEKQVAPPAFLSEPEINYVPFVEQQIPLLEEGTFIQ
jgi:hypothetical protein